MYLPFPAIFMSVFIVIMCFFFAQKACLLHEEYLLQSAIIEKDAWLRVQCSNPETYAKINHHPGLCEKIEATARVGAFWHALNKVACSLPFEEALGIFQRLSWQVALLVAILFVVFPSFVASHVRSRYDVLPLVQPSSKHV